MHLCPQALSGNEHWLPQLELMAALSLSSPFAALDREEVAVRPADDAALYAAGVRLQLARAARRAAHLQSTAQHLLGQVKAAFEALKVRPFIRGDICRVVEKSFLVLSLQLICSNPSVRVEPWRWNEPDSLWPARPPL